MTFPYSCASCMKSIPFMFNKFSRLSIVSSKSVLINVVSTLVRLRSVTVSSYDILFDSIVALCGLTCYYFAFGGSLEVTVLALGFRLVDALLILL